MSKREYIGLGTIKYLRDQERKGKMILGMLFDDGGHGMVNTWFSLKVNANFPNKGGAWEFLSFVLSREAQDYFDGIKDIGQVRDVVKNRVQLYLDERQ